MVFLELILALCSAAGLLALGWLLLGKLVAPVGRAPIHAVLSAKGEAAELEQTVRGLLWLQSGGLARFTIVVVDRGLNELGRAVVAGLQSTKFQLIVCAPEDVQRYI